MRLHTGTGTPFSMTSAPDSALICWVNSGEKQEGSERNGKIRYSGRREKSPGGERQG